MMTSLSIRHIIMAVKRSFSEVPRGEKASLYAANGIADYWIINLAARQILVHRQPVKDVSQPRGWRYESIALLQPADRLAPLAKMGETINMSEVLR
jgi:Uma2 family endonuclease